MPEIYHRRVRAAIPVLLAVNPAESEVPKLGPMYPDASSSYDATCTPESTNGVMTDPGWRNQASGWNEEPASPY